MSKELLQQHPFVPKDAPDWTLLPDQLAEQERTRAEWRGVNAHTHAGAGKNVRGDSMRPGKSRNDTLSRIDTAHLRNVHSQTTRLRGRSTHSNWVRRALTLIGVAALAYAGYWIKNQF